MAIRVFSDEDLERLRSFPEINREELIRFFTLTAADVEFIDPGRGRDPGDRLGGWPFSCARCRGWGSSRTTSLRPHPLRSPAWRSWLNTRTRAPGLGRPARR